MLGRNLIQPLNGNPIGVGTSLIRPFEGERDPQTLRFQDLFARTSERPFTDRGGAGAAAPAKCLELERREGSLAHNQGDGEFYEPSLTHELQAFGRGSRSRRDERPGTPQAGAGKQLVTPTLLSAECPTPDSLRTLSRTRLRTFFPSKLPDETRFRQFVIHCCREMNSHAHAVRFSSSHSLFTTSIRGDVDALEVDSVAPQPSFPLPCLPMKKDASPITRADLKEKSDEIRAELKDAVESMKQYTDAAVESTKRHMDVAVASMKLHFDAAVEQLTSDFRDIFNDRTVGLQERAIDHERRLRKLERVAGIVD